MKKNNNRLYIILAIVALIGLSWYQLLNNSVSQQAQYDAYISEARSKADLNVKRDASDAYDKAREMHDSIELRKEIANFYKTHYNLDAWGEYCEKVLEDFPKEPAAYEMVMDYYYETQDYAVCLSKYKEADKKHLVTDKMKNMYNELYYAIEELTSFSGVGEFCGGMCAVKNDVEKWGFADESGGQTVGYAFIAASPFTSEGLAAVKREMGEEKTEYVLIDRTGEILHTDPQKDTRTITDMGLYSSGKISAQIDGKYCYMDVDFKALYGSYDFASTYSGDCAVVKNNDKWMIIDGSGKQVGSETFDDIKLDRALVPFRNGVGFGKKNGKYYLIDTSGKIINDTGYEDADAFASEGYAAVMYEGSWGFVDTKGDIVIKPQYKYAKSFAGDLAPVSDGEQWAYITENNDIVLQGADNNHLFLDAKQFSDGGCGLVKIDEDWVMIRLFRKALGA